MEWTEVLSISVPILALMGWVYNRIEKKADERHKDIKYDMKEIKGDIKELKISIQNLDSRVSRIEGQLMPSPWEPKVKEKK